MNRALRIIIPLLLVIAVLGCVVWYLLVYDRDFTQDILLQQARNFEEKGNHRVSAWLYGVAYQHSSKEPMVAIELAEQYAKDKNYTKAEYTLTHAISETGSPVLYAKLCELYVEQDKLLDAVTMLDSITDLSVKETLEAMRPAAPVLSPDPGFYNQYISVSASSQTDCVYVGLNGEYPSTAIPYAAPITLEAGETTVSALAIGDNGLVSKLAVGGYTIVGVVELVEFQDEAIKATVRDMLMLANSTTIYTCDLWQIESFSVPEDAKIYEDLRHFTSLSTLRLPHSTQTDLTFLSELKKLEELEIVDTNLSSDELAAIGKLTGLKKLTLRNCGITSITALAPLKELTYLDLSGNTIRNITPLSTHSKLCVLNLSGNAVADINTLSNLTKLTLVNLSQNSIVNIDALLGLNNLNELHVSHNQIASLEPLKDMSNLQILTAANNNLTDLPTLSGVRSLQQLDLSNNALTDVQAISDLKNLTKLVLAHNQITKLPTFSADCSLIYIDASHNQLADIDTLSVLKQLNEVQLDYNKDLKSLKPLESCELLVLVNAYGTGVKEVSFLTEKSIIVNFDPTT